MSNGKKGFTLVELIVVIVIVGILAAAAMPMMSTNIDKAKKAEGIAGLGAIRTAARLYYVEKTIWPANTGDLSSYLIATDLNGPVYSWANYSLVSNVAKASYGTLGTINMDVQTGAVNGY